MGVDALANRSVVLTTGNQSFLLDLNKSYQIRGGNNLSASFFDDSMVMEKKLDRDLQDTT